jgi:hypothetical protein
VYGCDAGSVRWRAPGITAETTRGDPEEYRRHYGDSIIDARTSVDPQVGMRPIDTTHER